MLVGFACTSCALLGAVWATGTHWLVVLLFSAVCIGSIFEAFAATKK
jgi:hypothetical protein